MPKMLTANDARNKEIAQKLKDVLMAEINKAGGYFEATSPLAQIYFDLTEITND